MNITLQPSQLGKVCKEIATSLCYMSILTMVLGLDGVMDLSDNLGARSTNDLRGDYSAIAADFTTAQNWADYTDADHNRWRRLFAG